MSAAKLRDLVKVNIATTGTGTVTFGTVLSDSLYLPSEVGLVDGDPVRYVLTDGTNREEGTGVIGGSVTTMTRTVKRSRITGTVSASAKINLSGASVLALSVAEEDILSFAEAQTRTGAETLQARSNLGSTTVGDALFIAADVAAAKVALAQATASKSSDYTLVTGDRGKHFSLTGDAKTLSFLAAATATDGYEFSFSNDGTGVWTFDPSGAETVDTFTTMKIFPGESGTVRCDGTSWRTRGLISGFVLLETRTITTAASADFTRIDPNRFCGYRFEIELLVASTLSDFFFRASISGSFVTTSVYVRSMHYAVNNTAAADSATADNSYLLKAGLSSTLASGGHIDIHSMTSSHSTFSHELGGFDSGANIYSMRGMGGCAAGGTFDGFRLAVSTGTYSCIVRFYGRRK